MRGEPRAIINGQMCTQNLFRPVSWSSAISVWSTAIRDSRLGATLSFLQRLTGSNAALGKLLEESRNYLLLIANRQLGEGVREKLGASDFVQETFAEASNLRSLRGEVIPGVAGVAGAHFGVQDRTGDTTFCWHRKAGYAAGDFARNSFPGRVAPGPARLGIAIGRAGGKLAALQTALERLPPDYRLAIEVRSFAQRPFAELAAKLGRSAEAARRLWLRAVVRLKSELAPKDHEQRPSQRG